MNSTKPSSKELSNLVPLNEVEESLRDHIVAYARIDTLEAGAMLVTDPSNEALYLLTGSATPRGADDLPSAVVVAEEWQAFEPNHALSPCRRLVAGPNGARVARLDRGRLGTLLTWSELSGQGPNERILDDWLPAVLRSELLSRLPGANLQAVLARVQAQTVSAGDMLVTQGEAGEHYFLIVDGEYAVLRESDSGLPLLIANLHAGDSFGEEALLSDTPRNASVEAESDGSVLRIGKADFVELIGSPLVRTVSLDEAHNAITGGAQWLDVRTKDEFTHDGKPDAISLPLAEIRDRKDTLAREQRYFVICDSGRRSASAVFLLCESGFDATAVGGGLIALDGRAPPPPPQANLAELDDELAITDAALDYALRHQAATTIDVDEDRTDPNLRVRINDTRAHVDAILRTKVELEQRIRDTQANAARVQAESEAKRQRLQDHTHAKIAEERTRLRAEYDRATSAITELRAQKAAAVANVDELKRDLDVSLQEIQSRLDSEAASIHEELLHTRDEARAKEATLRDEQSAREKALVQDTEERLREERQRVERHFAESLAQLQVAQTRLEALETERVTARQRAQTRREAALVAQEKREQQLQEKIEATTMDGNALHAVETAATAESLRLDLQAEVEVLLGDAQVQAQARAEDAQRQLEMIAERDRSAQERAQADALAERGMLSDIAVQLDHEKATGDKAYAQRMAELAGEARNSSAAQRGKAQDALARARAHIARIKQDRGEQ
ncbi:MAG: cyclic nucleotide-binding domain-containing protein [Chromatiales bacterium]|jgi:rhodanese-related sulfurtransferase|nr:cyclic nucleotide-binding domain-containing protein [Chromatiales bacterium]